MTTIVHNLEITQLCQAQRAAQTTSKSATPAIRALVRSTMPSFVHFIEASVAALSLPGCHLSRPLSSHSSCPVVLCSVKTRARNAQSTHRKSEYRGHLSYREGATCLVHPYAPLRCNIPGRLPIRARHSRGCILLLRESGSAFRRQVHEKRRRHRPCQLS